MLSFSWQLSDPDVRSVLLVLVVTSGLYFSLVDQLFLPSIFNAQISGIKLNRNNEFTDVTKKLLSQQVSRKTSIETVHQHKLPARVFNTNAVVDASQNNDSAYLFGNSCLSSRKQCWRDILNIKKLNETSLPYQLNFISGRVLPQKIKKQIIQSQKPVDCQCKSLFHIGSCGFDKIGSSYSTNRLLRQFFPKIKLFRSGEPYSMIETIKVLSSLINPFPFPISHNEKISPRTLNGITFAEQRQKILPVNNTKNTWTRKNTASMSPVINCTIHLFSPYEIKRCLMFRRRKRGSKLRIAFIGDSLVRNLMEQMVDHLRNLLVLKIVEPRNMNIEDNFLDKKVKHDIKIDGLNIVLEFFWSAFMNKDTSLQRIGPTKILRSWVDRNYTKHVPDIIIMDTGLWEFKSKDEVDAIADVINDMKNIRTILEKLSTASFILWRSNAPVKSWLAKGMVPNSALDLLNQVSFLSLKNSGVWFWDSFLLLLMKEYEHCRIEYNMTRHMHPQLCGDYMHPSKKVTEAAAANMVWNHVCNSILSAPAGYCCSGH